MSRKKDPRKKKKKKGKTPKPRLEGVKELRVRETGQATEPLTITYDNLRVIQELGFLIPATINVPTELQKVKKSAGVIPSRPVEGFMIVDTGAQMTSLRKSAVGMLNINPVSTVKTHGVHGVKEVHMYYVIVKVGKGKHSLYKQDQFAEADLEGGIFEHYEKQGIPVIGLLGRDYFNGKVLTCDFKKGSMTISW